MTIEYLTRVVDDKLIRQEFLQSMVFGDSIKDVSTLPVYVIGSRSRPFYERATELRPGILLLVNDDNVVIRVFIIGEPTEAFKHKVDVKLPFVANNLGAYLMCWIKTPGTLAPFRMVLPKDQSKPTILLLDTPSAMQQAQQARFFMETTVIKADFPSLAEFSARYGEVIYKFDEV